MGQFAMSMGPVTWNYTVSGTELCVQGGIINHRIPLASIERFAVWSALVDINNIDEDISRVLHEVGDDIVSRSGQLWVQWSPSPGKSKIGKYAVDIKDQQLQGLLSDLGVARPGTFCGWGHTAKLCALFGVRNWTPVIGVSILALVAGAFGLYIWLSSH